MEPADENFEKAKKKLSRWLFKDEEGAQELFMAAGAQYRLDKNFLKAGESYMRAGDLAKQQKELGQAGECYKNASQCYKKVDMDASRKLMALAINIQIETNRLAGAARLEKDFAESLEEDGNLQEAQKHYKLAAQYFEAEDQPAHQQTCMIKIAKIYGELDQFEAAMTHYEEIAQKAANGPIKHQAIGFFLNSLLCRAALVDGENRGETCIEYADALTRYQQVLPQLRGTRELEFLQKLLEAIEESDEEKLSEVIAMLNDLRMLDSWKTHILFVIKEKMESIL